MRKTYTSTSVVSDISFLIFLILSIEMMVAQNTTVSISVNVGVILDLEQLAGKKELSCINMALSDFYAANSHYKTRLVLNTKNSMDDVVGAAAAAVELIKKVQVQAIIGPTTSMQADFVIDLGQKAQVPIITYSASGPSLARIRSPYFFRATQNYSTQVGAIRALIQRFRWREAVPIYVDNEYGDGFIPYLTYALQSIDTRIPYRSVLSLSCTDDQIGEELYKLMSMQTRVFILHMPPPLGSRIFTKAKEVGMMSKGYVWMMSDWMSVSLSSLSPSIIDSMQGVLGVRPYVPKSKELESFYVRWKSKFLQDNPGIVNIELSVYELWAYDATIALAMAIEKAGTANFGFRKANTSSNDLATLGVSLNGPGLVRALSYTSFKGLSGDFIFVNGQLPSSPFQIINVIGDGARGVGFWTSKNELVKKLDSTISSNLAPVIWPGDSYSVPKGWVIPTNGNKLRILVPVKYGYREFVKVARDPSTNTTSVTGYCIDVFDAVMKTLPYAVTYEYIPFANPDGTSAGTYNDLVDQVSMGKFDGGVGDITIIANRSLHVDFTLPYTESGVSMIVPVKDKKSKNAWVFLKPLTWDLWITSFCFFVFIGFVVWVLEHRINENFRGPPSYQAGTAFWFSFSTMVFAHRERVVSNLGRIVVIIWCFVVLILTQSYTASLSSLLTVQQLMPTVTDVHQLINNGDNVGYLQGSFVFGILKGLGFHESKLKVYNSTEEFNQLFVKGTRNGGIAAAFDEVSYIKLILAEYCSKYSMVEPKFKTGGFGFVFPEGSPLVADVSRAILNVIEGDKMKEIEKAWFGKQSNCPDPSTSVSSHSLSLTSFWGLFLIAGIVSVLALMIFGVMFTYEHWQVIVCSDSHSDSHSSVWSRILHLFRIFDKKDLKSHTFRKSEANAISTGAPSPSTFSVQTDFLGDQETPIAQCEQPSQQLVLNIELANPNQDQDSREYPTTNEITFHNY